MSHPNDTPPVGYTGAAPFTYELPHERIAQRPVHPPDAARMLVIDRSRGSLSHATFRDLPSFLRPNDHLVFNKTQVIPARLFGQIDHNGQHDVEILLVSQREKGTWQCIGRPLKKIRAAGVVTFNSRLRGRVYSTGSTESVLVQFETTDGRDIDEALREHGTMPIPPYIRDGRGDSQDIIDYQTIFAEQPGSIAAPTASLHFTPELLDRIAKDAHAQISRITLHVGSASFLPIIVNGVLRPPTAEQFEVPPEVLLSLQETKARGGRVIAVGTTVVRALESAARGMSGESELFIQPGFEFALVDAVITNFHQPSTTHLLLVESLMGYELLERSYHEALQAQYRFLSYGDGMFIV
jgi:S-adenosylmethionine:tRNA ribosyltransferase-isomerase